MISHKMTRPLTSPRGDASWIGPRREFPFGAALDTGRLRLPSWCERGAPRRGCRCIPAPVGLAVTETEP
jgi:hypothetical protein